MKKSFVFKLFTVLLAVMMIVPMLAACKGDGEEADTTKPQGTTSNQPSDTSGKPDDTGSTPGDDTGSTPGDDTGSTPGDDTGSTPGDDTGDDPGDVVDPPVGEDEEPVGDYLYLAERFLTEYSLVYPVGTPVLAKSEALAFVELIQEESELLENEIEMQIIEDGSQHTKKEIYVGIIGKMGRPEIEEMVAEYNLTEWDYLIKVDGDDLIIALGCKEVSLKAFTLLKERLIKIDKENKSVAVPSNLEYVYISDKADIVAKDSSIKEVRVDALNETELLFTVNPNTELDVPARITYTGNGGWRIQTKYSIGEPFDEVGAAQLVNPASAVAPQKLTYWEEDNTVIAQAPDGSYIAMTLDTFSVKFCNAEGELVRILKDMNHTITGRQDKLTMYLDFSLDATEAIYGTGERFDTVNQRGESVVLQNGQVADDEQNAYVAIPLLTSSTGSGIFINSNSYMVADIGVADPNTMNITFQSGNIDCYVYTTDRVTDVLRAYADLSGYANEPEEWMTGLLVCRYDESVNTKEAVYAMIAQMERYGTPWTGIVIDGWNLHDFSKHAEFKEICDLVHSMGKKVICNVDVGFFPGEFPEGMYEDVVLDDFYLSWTFTYYYTEWTGEAWSTSTLKTNKTINIPMIETAGGIPMMDTSGGVLAPLFVAQPNVTSRPTTSNPFTTEIESGSRTDNTDNILYDTKTYLDITNPDAVEWFFGDYWTYLMDTIGFDGAKVDGGNLLPDTHGTLNFYDASVPTGGARAWYTTRFIELLDEVLAQKPDGGICITAGGGIGTQRNAYVLGGEQSRTTNRLARQVKGLLSAGLSGLPFVSYEIGGSFYKNGNELSLAQEAAIFLRGTQFAAFTASMQTADGEVRGPFDFADEDPAYEYVTDLYRLYAKLHQALAPYVGEYSTEAAETGLPLARHLVMMWQDDANVYELDDQYMFGDAFLVAPELYGATSRSVYLPEGEWVNLFTGESYVGGQEINVEVTMAQIPVFYNKNTTSATAAEVLEDVALIINEINAVELP